MTLPELKALAASKGIQITPKGYKLYGTYHRIADWRAMLTMIEHHDPVGDQLARWLRQAVQASACEHMASLVIR